MIDHLMVTAGRSYYGRLADMDFEQVRRDIEAHLLLVLQIARHSAQKVRPGGTLLFMGGTGARRPGIGLAIASTLTAAIPALAANLALELAPVRVNVIAAGFVDTRLSGIAPGRGTRKPPQSASRHTSHPARRRTSRRRGARCTHHDQHGPHRRDLRHRRRATACRAVANNGRGLFLLAKELCV